MTAEFGRNAVVANVDQVRNKISSTDQRREYYRGAPARMANTVQNKE
jgi:hypothetical protein